MALDLGISEWIGDRLGIPRDPVTGGSQLFGQRVESGGASRDIPPYVPPTNNNTSSSGGGSAPKTNSNSNYQIGGWYDGRQWDGSRFGNPGEVIVGNNSGGNSGGGGGNSVDQRFLDEINNMFSSSMNYLGQLEGNARSDYDQSVAQTGKAYDLALQNSQQSYALNQQALGQNQTDLDNSKRSALAEAIRAYNALAQQRISRFGGGSSAGEAVGELANQEYFRQQGQTEQAFMREANKLKMQMSEIAMKQKQYEDYLELDKQNQLTELKKELNNTLSKIQMERNATEQAKSQMRINVIQDSMNRARQINDATRERGATILDRLAELQAEKTGEYNALYERALAYSSGDYFNTTNQFMGADLSQRSQGSAAYRFNPYSKNDDEENPFFEG